MQSMCINQEDEVITERRLNLFKLGIILSFFHWKILQHTRSLHTLLTQQDLKYIEKRIIQHDSLV